MIVIIIDNTSTFLFVFDFPPWMAVTVVRFHFESFRLLFRFLTSTSAIFSSVLMRRIHLLSRIGLLRCTNSGFRSDLEFTVTVYTHKDNPPSAQFPSSLPWSDHCVSSFPSCWGEDHPASYFPSPLPPTWSSGGGAAAGVRPPAVCVVLECHQSYQLAGAGPPSTIGPYCGIIVTRV